MSISTFSSFYFDLTADNDAYLLDFDEGGSELTATLNFGDYTLTDFLAEVETALNAAGALTYTVSLDRATRYVTIAASGTFSLLVSSGSHGAAVFTKLGFSGTDKTAAATYTGTAACGSVYLPQFKLQGYVPAENYTKRLNVTNHETASGLVESVSFGTVRFIEMDIKFATDIYQPSTGPITNNQSGVANLNTFMQFLITKAALEFMPDSSSPNTYFTVLLESTSEDKNGTAYRLKEMIDIKLAGYYSTDKLKFRVVE